MVDVLMLAGSRLIVSETLRRQLAEAGVRVEVREDKPVEDRTLSVSELTMAPVVEVRAPVPPPPWHDDQPWLKRKKKGRS